MDAILRAMFIYFFLYLLLRISGKRSLSEMTAFDLLLLLIISEATQQAMVDHDHSIVHSALLITTLVGLDIALSLIKRNHSTLDKVLDSVPLILVEHGRPIRKHLDKERVSEEDVLAAARQLQGVSRMEDIEYAVLEGTGHISIIPRASKTASDTLSENTQKSPS